MHGHHSLVVGPGSYDAKIAAVRKRSPEYTMGAKHSGERAYADEMLPGPGTYQSRSFVGLEGPKFSIQDTVSKSNERLGPGPGHYNPNDKVIREKVKAFKMT